MWVSRTDELMDWIKGLYNSLSQTTKNHENSEETEDCFGKRKQLHKFVDDVLPKVLLRSHGNCKKHFFVICTKNLTITVSVLELALIFYRGVAITFL